MPTEQITQMINNFNAGELSPMLDMRTDLKKYMTGCLTLKNFIPTVYGGAVRRPGTYYIAETKHSKDDDDKVSRLIPFEYNVEQAYVLEFGEEYIRFFKDGGQIYDPSGTESEISDLDNLIAHWKLDDNSPAANDVDDDEENHDGELVDADDSSVTTDTVSEEGTVGDSCFNLDGQYTVDINDHADFTFSDFSIGCWAYLIDSPTSFQVLASKWQNNASAREWRFGLNANKQLELRLAQSETDLSGDLIAQWKMNDDAANDHVDDSEETHDASLKGGDDTADKSEAGKINDCLHLNGSDDYIEVDADSNELSFGDGSDDSAFSISAWVYFDTLDSNGAIIGKWDETSGSEDREWLLYGKSNKYIRFYLKDESSNGYFYAQTDNNTVETGKWHHIVATYNGTYEDGGIKIYIDGEEKDVDTYGLMYTAMENGSTKVLMGALTGSGGDKESFLDGKLDNVYLIGKELTSAEVLALYNGGDGTEDLSSTEAEIYATSDDVIGSGWHFFAATWDESEGVSGITLYVDGESVDVTTVDDDNFSSITNTAQEVRIGSQRNTDDDANENFWQDKIDNVFITSDIISSSEISTIYDNPAYEIESPYQEEDLFDIHFVQSADVLYLVHPEYAPRKLERSGHTSWTLSEIDFTWGPFRDKNEDNTITLTPSATTGDGITLTASEDLFVPDHVGALFKLAHPKTDNSQYGTLSGTGTKDAKTLKNTCRFRTTDAGGDSTQYKIQRKLSDDTNYHDFKIFRGGVNYDISWEEEEKDGAIYRINCTNHGAGSDPAYTLSCEQNFDVGYVKVTAVASATSATVDVIEDLGSTDATWHWAEGSWSDYRGWPRSVEFYQNRLCFAGNTYEPLTIWLSESKEFEGFRAKTLAENDDFDDDALVFTISAAQQNMIRWLISQEALLVGTAGAEGKMQSYNRSLPLSPTNVPEYRRQSSYGSSSIQPLIVNDSTLFVPRNTKRLREFKYDFDSDIFVARDLTVYSEHITGDGIVEIAHQQNPDPILWAVRDDGVLLGMTYERLENIYGWFRVVTDGEIESVAVISSAGQSGTEDEVWVIVKRTIDGDTKRYLEYFQPRDWGDTDTDVFFVDSGLSAAGSDGNTYVGGLDHLEGETVDILIDGKVGDQQEVGTGNGDTAGYVDLKIGGTAVTSSTKVHVGLNYESELQPMKLEISNQYQGVNTIRGRKKRIHEAVISFKDTLGGKYGRDASNLDELDHSVTGTDGSMTEFKTEEETVVWPGIDETEGNIIVKQTYPLPMTVRAIIPKLDITEI